MDESRPSILAEYRTFLIASRRWWLTCLAVMGAILLTLAMFGQSGASPFLYTLY